MQVDIHIYIFIHTHTHTHIYIYIYIHIYVCVCVYVRVCVCMYYRKHLSFQAFVPCNSSEAGKPRECRRCARRDVNVRPVNQMWYMELGFNHLFSG